MAHYLFFKTQEKRGESKNNLQYHFTTGREFTTNPPSVNCNSIGELCSEFRGAIGPGNSYGTLPTDVFEIREGYVLHYSRLSDQDMDIVTNSVLKALGK